MASKEFPKKSKDNPKFLRCSERVPRNPPSKIFEEAKINLKEYDFWGKKIEGSRRAMWEKAPREIPEIIPGNILKVFLEEINKSCLEGLPKDFVEESQK